MRFEEKQTDTEEIIVRHIKLTRGLVVALSCVLVVVALLGYLTLTGERAVASEAGTSGQASSAQSTGMRQYYLTKSAFGGNQALSACAPGYHMASLWEIADPSALEYNTSLGFASDDSGQGPVTTLGGWVRTGCFIGYAGGIAGAANCNLWGSGENTDYGSAAVLLPNWENEPHVGVWLTGVATCGTGARVWCVED